MLQQSEISLWYILTVQKRSWCDGWALTFYVFSHYIDENTGKKAFNILNVVTSTDIGTTIIAYWSTSALVHFLHDYNYHITVIWVKAIVYYIICMTVPYLFIARSTYYIMNTEQTNENIFLRIAKIFLTMMSKASLEM